MKDVLSFISANAYEVNARMTPAKIKNIRLKIFGFSQEKFAEFLGISYHTYKNWEIGHRHPSSPAVALLSIAEKFPDVFLQNRKIIIEQMKKQFAV